MDLFEMVGIEIAIDDIPLRVCSPSGKNLSSAYFISLDLSVVFSRIHRSLQFETVEDVTFHLPSAKEDKLGPFVTDMVLVKDLGEAWPTAQRDDSELFLG